MQTMIKKLSEKLVAGGSGDHCQNPNKNTGDPTPSNKIIVTFYRQWNMSSIVIRVELILMARVVVAPAVERIDTLKRKGIRIRQRSLTRWEVTPSAIICGDCGVSQ